MDIEKAIFINTALVYKGFNKLLTSIITAIIKNIDFLNNNHDLTRKLMW